MQAVKIQNCRPPGYGTLRSDWWVSLGFESGHTVYIFWQPVKLHPKCSSKTLITMYQTAQCPNKDLSRILAILSTSYPVPKNIRNKRCVGGNTTLGKLSYRKALCFLHTEYLILHTFSTICTQYFTFCLSDCGYKIWNTSSLDIRVRITYDEFQFS